MLFRMLPGDSQLFSPGVVEAAAVTTFNSGEHGGVEKEIDVYGNTYTLYEDGMLYVRGKATIDADWKEMMDYSKVQAVFLEQGIPEIGENAFCLCNNMRSIVISNSVKEIKSMAFYGCSSLEIIDIPDGITTIESGLFFECTKLKTITIPSSVTCIESLAFKSCTSLKRVYIPESVTLIGKDVFEDCYSLSIFISTSYTEEYPAERYAIENGIRYAIELGENTYTFCPNGAVRIEGTEAVDDAWKYFVNKNNIHYVYIEEGIPEIAEGAFYECYELETVVIPSSVKSIGVEAFGFCSNLTSITIPQSVTSIEEGTFISCDSLKRIVVEEGNAVYDSRDNCNAIIETKTNTLIYGCQNTVIPSSVTSIADSAFLECNNMQSIRIPSSVSKIGEYSFLGCENMQSVIIPSSVTSIGEGAFEECENLTIYSFKKSKAEIYAEKESLSFLEIKEREYEVKGNIYILSEEGNLTIKGKAVVDDSWKDYIEKSLVQEVIIEEGIQKIGTSAFEGCRNVKRITLPESLLKIEWNAFGQCISLHSINIPDSVMSIGGAAFWECINLEEISIPSNLTGIQDNTFDTCTNLKCIRIPKSVSEIGENAFYGCDGICKIEVEEGNLYYDSRENCNAIIRTEDNVLIRGCRNTKIPSNVVEIDSLAFIGCCSLDSITIPESVTRIGCLAFYECYGLKRIIIPKSVECIDELAFNGCYNMNLLGSLDSYAATYAKENNIHFIPLESLNNIIGDVDGNGTITAADALGILKYIAGLQTITDAGLLSVADVNGDSCITANDALDILKKIAGLITSFKAELG